MIPGYSKLIICDFILPDMNAGLFPSLLDIQMMALSAGMERSEEQWKSLLSTAGLNITGFWHGAPGMESVIEAMVKVESKELDSIAVFDIEQIKNGTACTGGQTEITDGYVEFNGDQAESTNYHAESSHDHDKSSNGHTYFVPSPGFINNN
jgi:hypothetical protein